MVNKCVVIVSVVACAVIASGLGVASSDTEDFSAIELEGDGFGEIRHSAAFTRIPNAGDVFWLFYPTTAADGTSKPLLVWLDGVTGLPPSLLANFGMLGPYDINMNIRSDSWINGYNLLFVDAPLGTGFSSSLSDNSIPTTLEENAKHLSLALESFYISHSEYRDTPLYILGQGSGAPLAVSLASNLAENCDATNEANESCFNVNGVIIGNGIISPALALTKLGFYLEELAYVDDVGRAAIENFSTEINALVNSQQYEAAFDKFLTLNDFVNNEAGAYAINVDYVIQKLINESTVETSIQRNYLQDALPEDISAFMNGPIAAALGITNAAYDSGRIQALEAFKNFFMIPTVDKIEHLLQNTNINVTIYNGNLDATSNTPGQLEWVNNLQWDGQESFVNGARQTLSVDNLVEGYFRETDRLAFYWVNAAGQSVPFENAVAMRCIIDRVTAWHNEDSDAGGAAIRPFGWQTTLYTTILVYISSRLFF